MPLVLITTFVAAMGGLQVSARRRTSSRQPSHLGTPGRGPAGDRFVGLQGCKAAVGRCGPAAATPSPSTSLLLPLPWGSSGPHPPHWQPTHSLARLLGLLLPAGSSAARVLRQAQADGRGRLGPAGGCPRRAHPAGVAAAAEQAGLMHLVNHLCALPAAALPAERRARHFPAGVQRPRCACAGSLLSPGALLGTQVPPATAPYAAAALPFTLKAGLTPRWRSRSTTPSDFAPFRFVAPPAPLCHCSHCGPPGSTAKQTA